MVERCCGGWRNVVVVDGGMLLLWMEECCGGRWRSVVVVDGGVLLLWR